MKNSLSAHGIENIKVEPFPHQINGIKWMTKQETIYWRGGILADDMGLGKSFQTLATIVNCAIPGTTLIVMPLSLISQWQKEIVEKLSIPLKVAVYHGSGRGNVAFGDYDIVLTTYGTLSRDFDQNGMKKKGEGRRRKGRFNPYIRPEPKHTPHSSSELDHGPLLRYNWLRVVLDECQQIKNGGSVVANAAHALNARFRWLLSGTPIQNKREEFMSMYRFVQGKSTNSVKHALEELLPQILRRTKDEVLTLPTKKIVRQSNILVDQERAIYDKYEEVTKAEAYDIIHSGKNRMKQSAELLILLLRMRQIADHPRLVLPDCPVEFSSKQKKIMRILRSLRRRGIEKNRTEKIVVFSTFVEMLKKLKESLDALGWNYTTFVGSMSMKERQASLDRFNTDETCNILLMSTKAGNVGLNLTCASTVILSEPWWNPFVDEQAMDRVHRIGQKRKTVIYQMVSKGTIEERILYIQQKKKEMFAEFFDNGTVSGRTGLGVEDMKYLFKI